MVSGGGRERGERSYGVRSPSVPEIETPRNYKLGQAPVLPEGARERLFVFALALARIFDQAFDGRVPKTRRVLR
ncbi:hypothetical protein ANAPC5_01183 [Anaplasma phagocytophilum]|nr:hypothetical protein ANAPC5_01183 [Anaplasma phagocytophilum]